MREGVLIFIIAFTMLSALYIAFTQSLVRSVFALFFTLFGVGAVYAFLEVDFLAVIQVLVYVGGIAVLILFAVMLSKRPFRPGVFGSKKRVTGAFMISLLIFLTLTHFIDKLPEVREGVLNASVAESVGMELLTRYLIQFEIVTVVLLAVLVGSALLIRKEVKGNGD